jgi:hypothetical protein
VEATGPSCSAAIRLVDSRLYMFFLISVPHQSVPFTLLSPRLPLRIAAEISRRRAYEPGADPPIKKLLLPHFSALRASRQSFRLNPFSNGSTPKAKPGRQALPLLPRRCSPSEKPCSWCKFREIFLDRDPFLPYSLLIWPGIHREIVDRACLRASMIRCLCQQTALPATWEDTCQRCG